MGVQWLRYKNLFLWLVLIIFFFIFSLIFLPPFSFPSGSTLTVSDGTGLNALSIKLGEEKLVRSPFWFRVFTIVLGGERDMKAGSYYMDHPESSFSIAWRIVQGDHDIETIKLTIPEGFNTKKISALFDDRFLAFDNAFFEASAPEGYLFPDTYFVQVTVTASSTIKMFNDNFMRRIDTVSQEVESSGKTLEEIITMASILEGEAREEEDMAIVSGILWKRLGAGIPLQVDATFAYINGKTSKDLALDDLKIDSPYNTYLYRGLPPTPISNPGLKSIKAVLNPTETNYLYFLTGDDGKMHYSEDFEEHVENKLKYIKR